MTNKNKIKDNNDILDKLIKNSKIYGFIKNKYKYLLVILFYMLYQTNFILTVISNFGVDINKIPKTPRIFLFGICDFIYVVILFFMFKKEIKNGLIDLKNHFLERSLTSLQCWVIGCVFMTISSAIIGFILKQNQSANEQLVRESIKLAPLYMLFTCSVVAPFFEEMVFRRAFRGLIKNKTIFILLSGLCFGLLHVIGSYSSPLDFLYVIPYGSMGFCFAYLYEKTNNISLPIIIHMLHNTILVLVQICGG